MGVIHIVRPKCLVGLLTSLLLFSVHANAELKGGLAVAYGSPPAASLVLQSLDGSTTYDLAAMRGQVVVVNFWATWCLPVYRRDAGLGPHVGTALTRWARAAGG